jgi:hypothetical protein
LKQALGAFLLAVALAAPAPAQAAPSCRIPGGSVVTTGAVAKLVAVRTPGGRALYACIRRTGRKIALDDSFSDARLTGRWVAWQRAGGEGRWRIAVHDLRSGKERIVSGHVAAHSLRLTSRGTVAWAQRLDDGPGTPLFVNDTLHGGRLLDGGDVDATSLRLTGRRLTWFSGDVQSAATLR